MHAVESGRVAAPVAGSSGEVERVTLDDPFAKSWVSISEHASCDEMQFQPSSEIT
jgi:hypothetical protein